MDNHSLTGPASATLTAIVRDRYGWRPPLGVRALGDGLTLTYLIEGEGRRAIARVSRIAEPLNGRRLDFELALLAYLAGRALAVPAPLPAADGALWVETEMPGGVPGRLVLQQFVEGEPPALTPGTGRQVGEILAGCHLLADDFLRSRPGTLGPTVDDPVVPTLNREALLDLPAASVLERLRSNPERPGDAIAAASLVLLAERLAGVFPSLGREPGTWGLLHGDAHHQNFRGKAGGRLSLLDFEHLSLGWRVYDLATLVWGTFGRSGGNATVWAAIIDGYSTIRSPLPWETEALPWFIALRQVWWLGFHARHWGRWRRPWLTRDFFARGVELLEYITDEACG